MNDGARDWDRTSTPVRALPPQDSASTCSATRADRDPARARTWDPLINLPHRLSPAIDRNVVVWTISSPVQIIGGGLRMASEGSLESATRGNGQCSSNSPAQLEEIGYPIQGCLLIAHIIRRIFTCDDVATTLGGPSIQQPPLIQFPV